MSALTTLMLIEALMDKDKLLELQKTLLGNKPDSDNKCKCNKTFIRCHDR